MLTVTLTKTTVYFEGLTDEMYGAIKDKFPELEAGNKPNKITYMIKGTPEKLYNVLLSLSYDYDIEVY